MKKYYLLFGIILISITSVMAQMPDWSVNPSDYSYNMTVTGVINLNYSEERDTNYVAAFVNDTCRGVAKAVYKPEIDRYVFYLMIYSNETSEDVSLKVYDVSSNKVVDIPKTLNFQINGIIGSLDAPYIISNPTLSSESKILEYSIEGEAKDAVIDTVTNNIYVEIPWGSSFDNLIADFTTSPYAKVFVNGERQESGVTSNDFTDTVIYQIIAADETDTSFYNVIVSWENAVPTDIYLSDTVIDASYHKGSFIGYFTTEDKDTTDIHSYTLVDGEGDDDNYRFLIDGNKLYLNEDVYFETIDNFSIRVKTDDGKGGTFEKSFTIWVDYLSENSNIRANHIISPNGDGLFDTWEIQNAGLYKDCDITIVNNQGDVIFHSTGYETPWDGTYNGKTLPIGTYFYIIKTPDNIIYKGAISLIK